MRTCTKCNETKDLQCFGQYKDKRFGMIKIVTYTWCRTCMNKQCAEWQQANPEKILGSRVKKYWIGATWQQGLANFMALFEKQNRVCAICKQPETAKDPIRGTIRRMAVDHCHVTGKVRGLLCGNCNQAIGKLKDSLVNAKNLVAYLEANTASIVDEIRKTL